jgi:pyruvate,water dikinase
MSEYVISLDKLCMEDVGRVGGKNASLGEMLQNLAPLGVDVPGGFATTADAYREFLLHDGLQSKINERLRELDVDDVTALQKTGQEIRDWIMTIPYPAAM